VRWVTATIVAAVCIVLGFSPPQWFAAIITEPPPWLLSPVTRVLIILVGTISCFLLVAWDRLFSKTKEIPVAYFDCKMGYWPEAEQANNSVSFVIMQFALPHPTLGISSGGPIAKENHNKPFSSIAPLKCGELSG